MSYLTTIKDAVEKRGEQQEVARLLGISPAFLSDVLNKKRRVSKRLALSLEQHLGLDGQKILQAQLKEEWSEHVEDNSESN